MAKTRAEVQKAYRERKKKADANYLAAERQRQANYRVPAAELSKRKLKKRRLKNIEYCMRYRLKKTLPIADGTQNELNCEHAEIEVAQSNEISSSSDVTSTEAGPSRNRSTDQQKLLVQLPFKIKSPPNKKRSKALKRARNEITNLKENLKKEQQKYRRVQKRCQRITKKLTTGPSTSDTNTIIQSDLTPRSKTSAVLTNAGLNPQLLPKAVVKQIEFGNCLLSEIEDSVKANSRQKGKSVIKRILSGKILKKYRFRTLLNKETGLSRRTTEMGSSKHVVICSRRRLLHLRSLVKEKVLAFFERDDISRCMPGKNDAVKVDGQKKQVRILNDYLMNLHEKFLSEDPSMKLSFSTFCKLRPRIIHVTSLLSRNKCLCTKHQNMALKLKSLIKHGVNISPNPEVVARSISEEAMAEKFEKLKDEDQVEYEEWKSVSVEGKKKMRIVKLTETGSEFNTLMVRQYKVFLEHTQRVAAQYKALHDLKLKLPEGHAVIQMDFAENFVCQTMDEIQSAYWNATAASLHPVVVYFRSDTGDLIHKNLVYVSNVNHHNATAVYTILQKLVPEVKALYPKLTDIHYWTDSPSSQYRNRFMFNIIACHTEYFDDIRARWNYFECGHGKGPCDGIGGTSKRMAAQAIKQGKATIQDGRDFYKWATENEKSIQYFFYSQEEYDAAAGHLGSLKAKTVPGTMKLHAVQSTGDRILYARETSCYCDNCLNWNQPCDGWIGHDLSQVTPLLLTAPDTTAATEDQPPTDAVEETPTDAAEEPSTETAEEMPNDEPAPVHVSYHPNEGELLAVKYDDDWFPGTVLEVDAQDKDAFVSFMTKKNIQGNLRLQWPDRRDAIWCPFSDIIMPVEVSSLGRSRRYYTMDTDLVQAVENVMTTK